MQNVMEFPMRINKYLAHQGLATRRSADVLIESGRVFVNGKKATLGQQINENDRIEVRGVSEKFRYLLYYKPLGTITHSPGAGETDIAERIKKDHHITGLFPVGRLDKNSEGLIVLTNDGRITGRLLDPDNEHEKEYEVTVDRKITKWFLRHITEGVEIEGYRTKPAQAVRHPRDEHTCFITLTEGKKHQIRRMCAALGYEVKRLRRIRIMNLELRKLRPGQYHELTEREVKSLMRALGIS